MEELFIMLNRHSSENELGMSIYKPNGLALAHNITNGLQITYIKPGSYIHKNGNFLVDDIIIEINGERVTNYDKSLKKLRKLVTNHPRTPLMLKVLRFPQHRLNPPDEIHTQVEVHNNPNYLINQNHSQKNQAPFIIDQETDYHNYNQLETRHKQALFNNGHQQQQSRITPIDDKYLYNETSRPYNQTQQNKLNQLQLNQHFHQFNPNQNHLMNLTQNQIPASPLAAAVKITPPMLNLNTNYSFTNGTGNQQNQTQFKEEKNFGNPTSSLRRKGVKHTICIKKSKRGFGIKIAERDNMHGYAMNPIYITAITSTGSAHIDGRLREGDNLLEVNDTSLSGMSQHDVTSLLKNIGIDEPTKFVVLRTQASDVSPKISSTSTSSNVEVDNSPKNTEINNQHNETYTFDIPFNHTNTAGLGLSLAYEIDKQTRKSLGIYVMNILTEGAAWKDGRLKPGDKILAINGISPGGLTKEQASEALNAAVSRGIGPEAKPDTIRLTIQRQIVKDQETKLRTITSKNNNDSDNMLSSSSDDSAMSPKTQASISNKLSHDSSSRTNDTSSVLSQVNDFNDIPTNELMDADNMNTVPMNSKTWDTNNLDCDDQSSYNVNSCDEEGYEAFNYSFQREGFGRQSISEKRLTSMTAKTQSLKRNRILRSDSFRAAVDKSYQAAYD